MPLRRQRTNTVTANTPGVLDAQQNVQLCCSPVSILMLSRLPGLEIERALRLRRPMLGWRGRNLFGAQGCAPPPCNAISRPSLGELRPRRYAHCAEPPEQHTRERPECRHTSRFTPEGSRGPVISPRCRAVPTDPRQQMMRRDVSARTRMPGVAIRTMQRVR